MCVYSVKDLLMNVGDQFSKDEVSYYFMALYSVKSRPTAFLICASIRVIYSFHLFQTPYYTVTQLATP